MADDKTDIAKVVEGLVLEDECIECGDQGPWIDEATELCEMCYENTFGEGVPFPPLDDLEPRSRRGEG